ncbi:MAG: DNA repair protein RadC [Lagierella massiliensis]|nr:DNA repair protein RadC [Lagierella massiliensis]
MKDNTILETKKVFDFLKDNEELTENSELSKVCNSNRKKENCLNRRIKDFSEFEKPREKMRDYGPSTLTSEELVAILIGTGTKKYNAVELASRVLQEIENQNNYNDITLEELMKIEGIKLSKGCTLIAAIELAKRLNIRQSIKDHYKINSPKSLAKIFMHKLSKELREYFYVILLDTKNKIISAEVVSIGTLNSSLVHPREVFKPAIKKSAKSIILLHNHPSGDTSPSTDDIRLTNRLVESGKLLGIEVLDHLIIGDDKYLSFKEKSYF